MAKTISLLLILTVVAFSTAFGQDPAAAERATWENFSCSEGRFTFLVPTKPTVTNRELNSKVGKLTLYSYTSGNGVALFIGTFGDYPNAADDSDEAERILDSVRNGVIRGASAQLVSEKSMRVKGHPGRELTGTARVEEMDVIYTWRIFLVNRRLYQLTAATLSTNANHPDLTKFLNSFELTPQ